jgi:hypothetical protein
MSQLILRRSASISTTPSHSISSPSARPEPMTSRSRAPIDGADLLLAAGWFGIYPAPSVNEGIVRYERLRRPRVERVLEGGKGKQ